MKRTLLTGLFLIIGAAIVARLLHVDFETIAAADSGSESASVPFYDPSFEESSPTSSRTIKVPRTIYEPRTVYEEVQAENVAVDPRCKELSGLMFRKAMRMSDEELDAAIADLKAELDAQNQAADAELQKAVDILEQLVKQSAGTPAAQQASRVIDMLKSHGPTPTRDDLPEEPTANSVPTY